VKAAERAFRERDAPLAGDVMLLFDSYVDEAARKRQPRLLMFTADSFDLMLTVRSTPRGNELGGSLFGARSLTVEIRRPLRATITIHAGGDGVLTETLVPPGTASVLVHAESGRTWRSEWLTL
jgi:hypothetical protein